MADTQRYQKVLQLYRSTNIWATKNIAKAEVERHAKQLHGEIQSSLRDGEPIVARYYDTLTGYTFSYNTTPLSSDPYNTVNGANHIWVEGFDSFSAIPAVVDANSAAYIRVGNSSTTEGYDYYKLTYTKGDSGAESGVSSIFGVVYKTDTEMYIEWFDSAADAEAILKSLNVNDVDVVNGFVAAVKQKDGKIEPIHGTLSSENAIGLNQTGYTYKELGINMPSDFVLANDNHGTTVPSENISITSPKYFRKDVDGGDDVYYELQKDIKISLNISDSNNVLAQGYHYSEITASNVPTDTEVIHMESVPGNPTSDDTAYPIYIEVNNKIYRKSGDGISTNMTLRSLSQTEIDALTDGTNVKEAYKLVGNADGNETQIGETIKIYKDSSLHHVYLGHTDDTLKDKSQWSGTAPEYPTDYNLGTGNDALCFVYLKGDGEYELVAVDVESFLSENEFRDGFELKGANPHYTDYEETPAVEEEYWVSGETSFDSRDAAMGVVASATSPKYLRYGNTNNWKYLRKESGKEVYVKLAGDGGIDFKDEGTGVNKSLKIKIDDTDTNKYYEKLNDSTGATHRYDPGNENADAYGYVTTEYARQSATGYYKKDTYLHTTSNGLAVDQPVLENKITDNIQKVLYVNGENFNKDNDGNIKATITGEQITVAGTASTSGNTDMATVTEVEALNPSKGSPEYVEYKGLIYKLKKSGDTYAYEPFNIDKDTNLNDAIAILNYLTYNLDMGQFTINE